MTETASKVLGYSLSGTPLAQESVGKVLGYSLSGTPLARPNVSKVLAYALISLTSPTRRRVGSHARIARFKAPT